jgi:hypothetical protein
VAYCFAFDKSKVALKIPAQRGCTNGNFALRAEQKNDAVLGAVCSFRRLLYEKTFLARQHGQTGGQSFRLHWRQWDINGGEIRL